MTIRPARLLAAAILAAAGAVAVAGPARAAGSAGYCPDGNGVTVVVDYRQLGGGVVIRCAPGEQATGLAALENAGFTVTGTLRWGKAFVCRINGKPGIDTEPCVDTPPASAYWSYWHAPNGGSWTYSSQGVLARKPPLGSFEGWSFSSGRDEDSAPRPGVAPTRPAPPPPPPPPPPTATKPHPATNTKPPAGGGTAATHAPAGNPPAESTPTVGPASAPTPTEAAATDPAPADAAAIRPRNGSGPPLGTIAGTALIAVLAAAAAVIARRRRRHLDPGD